jgi:hypothetical protein
MTARRQPVMEFPLPLSQASFEVGQALDLLREAIGRASSLVDVLMLLDQAGVVLTAAGGAGDELAGTGTTLDFEDAKVDTFRVVAYGGADAEGSVLVLRDVDDDRELCRVDIPDSVGRMTGEWIFLPVALSGERSIEARVIGDGAIEQTLHNVHLQARTTHFR